MSDRKTAPWRAGGQNLATRSSLEAAPNGVKEAVHGAGKFPETRCVSQKFDCGAGASIR